MKNKPCHDKYEITSSNDVYGVMVILNVILVTNELSQNKL
jgi:hypothetical protein